MEKIAEHKCVQVVKFISGDPAEACELCTVKTPSPGSDEMLLRMLCRPIHPVDVQYIAGKYPGISVPSPVGMEGVGRIEQVGDRVTGFEVGQRVMVCKVGTWQEYMLVSTAPESRIFPVPDTVAVETAAQFYGNPWTAYGMLDLLNVPRGEYVLQTAAASVLGRMFIQLARHKGIKTINLVRRNEQKDELKAIGADAVINYKEEDVVALVREMTAGKMAYAAVDCIGGEVTKTVASSVREMGTVLVYGMLEEPRIRAETHDVLFRGINIQGFALGRYFAGLDHSLKGEVAAYIMELLEKRIIEPLTREILPLEEFKKALAMSQEPGGKGKILLKS